MRSQSNATVLTALLFIPLSSPSIDVYGKIGVANLEESFDVHVVDLSPECRILPFGIDPSCIFDSQVDQTTSHPYIGIGARFKGGGAWAFRVEYEGIDGDFGDTTTMLSLNVAWEL